MTATATHLLDDLAAHGLLHQATSESLLRAHLAEPGRVGYCGFDPTAPSLTIGNFIPIKLLMHLQRAGHRPIALVGGGTGLIGDPSGKDAERRLRTREEVEANVAAQRTIFERFLDFDGPHAARVVNNLDWLGGLGFLEVLRDVGKHFSVNQMIQKDSVRDRLQNREQGISYTEFSYQILQAYDFVHLHRETGCTLQLAGSDQFGNIVAGIDLMRRMEHGGHAGAAEEHVPTVFGITAPLVTTADGRKIGKTESGAIWLTKDRTSPYRFFQYWLNVADADLAGMLGWYTFLSPDERSAVMAEHEAAPHLRHGQRTLAREVTDLVHGEDERIRAERAGEAMFSGDFAALDGAVLDEIAADLPSSTHDRALLEGDGLALVELLPQTTLAGSKREAREFLGNGAVSVNGTKAEADAVLRTGDLLGSGLAFLKRGRKAWHACRFG